MSLRKNRDRRAYTMIETLVTMSVIGIISGSIVQVARGGARLSCRAGELQLATLVGERVMDQLAALPHERLQALAGQITPLDLAQLLGQDATRTATPGAGCIDGVEFSAELGVEENDAGLLELKVILRWALQRAQDVPAPLVLVQYRVDPAFSLAVR